ncbi:glycosyltransferase [Microbacterium sp. SYP-A9085]|uniref:glycosyltransferase family 2 protein n=1 Tax=Microbacterium sp. SYP-A9085 TaxID=2664454 RepID=UPI00129BF990|nr:glycosyltransferase [Microbacterium sp. SYP-A9085]MRH28915.1 glycosyltransferase [Microbacterium sp. SYP-A9085]
MAFISAVVPLYRVERYLPDLLRSLAAQRLGDDILEVIFVDDGSPDGSARLAQEWLAQTRTAGRVIRQANAGVSAARNAGMDAATGDWVTFPDSDDFVANDYFRRVARFLRRHGDQVSLASTRLVRLREPETRVRDVHALKFRFMAGDRRVSMVRFPDFFQLNVASVFFRRGDLTDRGVRFRTNLHASEDALFVAEFLLHEVEPVLGLVAGARYVYRRRAAADSAIDGFRRDPDTYIGRFRDGYAQLMERAAASGGVPEWLQAMFLYECQWLLPVQLTADGYASVLDADGQRATLDALAACAAHVDEDRLFRYDATALPLESRLLLQLLAGRPIPAWVGAYRRGPSLDLAVADPTSVEVRTGDERIDAVGAVSTPDYFGQQLLHRWSAAAPGGARVVADGAARPVIDGVRGDSPGQSQDRHRRRVFGQLRGAVPAREGEVRVWKPVPGPLGSPWRRLVWDAQLVLHRLARRIRRRRNG